MEAYQEELAKVKTLLRKEPRGMTIKEISHEIGINRNSVAKYMEMLLVSGQTEMKRVGRAKIYFHSQRVPVSALLDYSSEYIMVFNREGRIILLNDAILGWMGHEREALVGKTLDDALGYISDNQDLRNGVLLGLQGQASNMEVPVRTRGETLHFRIKSIPTTFEDGEIGVTVLMEDITERKRMLEELLIKDHAMESSINAFALSNLEGALTYVNPSFLELWGYEDEDEVLGRPATDFTQPEEHASKVIEALRDTGSWRGELTALRKDGSNPVVEMTASMVKDEKGSPLCMMASFFDVTERKRYEEKLEALHRHTVELGTAETVDDIAERTLNTIEQVLGFNIGSFGVVEGGLLRHILIRGVEADELFQMPLDGRGITVRAVKTGETQFVPDIREDEDYVIGLAEGLYEPLSELVVPVKIEGEVVAVINVENIKLNAFTDGDQMLLETLAEHVASAIGRLMHVGLLRASEERWRTLLEVSMDAVTVNVGTELVYVNRRLADLLGYGSPSELIGRDITELNAPEYREMIRARTLRRQRGEEVPERYELKLLRRDGTQIDAETLTSLIEYDGKPAALSFVRDITERMKAEEAIRESEEWHRAVFGGSLDAIFITGEDSRFMDVNEAAEVLTGYSKEELIGMSIPDLHDAPDLHAYESYFDRIMAGEAITSEAEILRKDGIKVPTEFSNRRILIRGVPYMHTTARNITERKRMEDKLREYAENLEDLVEERTRELQDAKTFAEL